MTINFDFIAEGDMLCVPENRLDMLDIPYCVYYYFRVTRRTPKSVWLTNCSENGALLGSEKRVMRKACPRLRAQIPPPA